MAATALAPLPSLLMRSEVHRSFRVEASQEEASGPRAFAAELASALKRGGVVPLPAESPGTFGATVRDDAAALELRKPALTRSNSSPCLSPSGPQSVLAAEAEAERFPQSVQPLGRLGRTRGVRRLLEAAAAGLDAGNAPKLESEGLGGTYLLRGASGERLAMFKPCDEEPFAPNNPKGFSGRALGEPGVSRAVRVGEAALREVAAYLLDHGRYARVPRTALVRLDHPSAAFHVAAAGRARPTAKVGSLQEFVRHDHDASEHGTSRFPPAEVHRLGILDLRLFNTDRHTGNILVRAASASSSGGASRSLRATLSEPQQPRAPQHCRSALELPSAARAALDGDAVELVPIDHGYCLPEQLEAVYFEWLHWPQASMPFSRDVLEYIASLDGEADARLLAAELPELRHEGAGRLLQLTTLTLQRGAAAGLCLAEIGSLMSRPLVRIGEEPSALEKIVAAALDQVARVAAGSGVGSPGSGCDGALSLSESEEGGGWAEESPLGELSEGDEAAACAPTPRAPATPRIAVPQPAAAAAARSGGGDGLQFDFEDGGEEHARGVAVPPGRVPLHAQRHMLESDGTTECDGDSSAFSSHASSMTSCGGGSAAMSAGRSPARPRPAAPSARHPGVVAWSPRRGGRSAPRPCGDVGGGVGGDRPASAGLFGRSLGTAVAAQPGHGGARRPPRAEGAATAPRAAAAAGSGDGSPPALASFSEVPAELWPAFMAAFVPLLDATLREHAAAASGAARATQLLTRGGTRLEAFGTSCPTGWMDAGMARRR